MNVLIVHNPVADLACLDDADVLVQTRAVGDALRVLGHEYRIRPWPEDMKHARGGIRVKAGDVVFNLVESIQGSGRTVHLVPSLLEELGAACTGGSSRALLHSTNKLLAKEVLAQHGLPTPAWLDRQDRGNARPPGRFIVKSVWEHGSFGLDVDNVVLVSSRVRLLAEMKILQERLGGECFAEEYVFGREFNLALVEQDGRPLVLAPAEILFTGHPQDERRVVGFRAKWLEQSREYRDTKRSLEFPEADGPLLRRLAMIAVQCWDAFALSGYARVDLRIDAKDRPWIIDVNVNPCLSPDAGFQASCAASGLSFAEVVDLLLQAAVSKKVCRSS
ncbi:MAG TPA: D-alanine--D-alanine ligase [Desulfonatronum sp.]|nr:D-alanine--D-alanine ligase [Desulfonatronum sp.]